MAKNRLAITDHGTYRAQLREIRTRAKPEYMDDQPLMLAVFQVPAQEVEALGRCLGQWTQMRLTSAALEAGEAAEPFVVWAEDRGGWWRAAAMGYTPNALDAGVFTDEDSLNLTKSDRKIPLSVFLVRYSTEGTVARWLKDHAGIGS